MKVEPSGVVMIGECELRFPHVCTALSPAPITAVWGFPSRKQFDICRSCLEEMVRRGEWEIQGAKIARKYDIAVYDKTERLQLVVEVRDYPYKPPAQLEEWAVRIRRNLIVHSGIPSAVYFLFASHPALFYLWTKEDMPEAAPHYSFKMQTELPSLYENTGGVSNQQQEDAIYSWLTFLVSDRNGVESRRKHPEWLYASGLCKAIQGGRIVRQAAPVEAKKLQAA